MENLASKNPNLRRSQILSPVMIGPDPEGIRFQMFGLSEGYRRVHEHVWKIHDPPVVDHCSRENMCEIPVQITSTKRESLSSLQNEKPGVFCREVTCYSPVICHKYQKITF